MSQWQLIFSQSRVNNGPYFGDILPAQNWDWPQGTWLQERLRYLRKPAPHRNGPMVKWANGKPDSAPSMPVRAAGGETHQQRLSVVPLLLADEEISGDVHEALLENRLGEAAALLVQKYGLSCVEAGQLLDVSAC
ncbi:MAG TPA: hypothetical protein VGL11_24020 [Candidatus Binatia bacterium]|jgi:hypothetical protein